ncbi:MAG TPA: bifunctional riboflavin kinase/FAD synthetase [Gammaproteobacteria bacterium]
MELIRGLCNLKPRHRGVVASIGNYDGVHRGHQAVLRELKQQARAFSAPATVIVFEPTPQEFFAPDAPPARLMRFGEKAPALAGQGVDRVLCLRFNRQMAQMSPEDFIERVLVGGLGVRYLVVGDDFRFGHARRGDFALLQQAGARHGFEVKDTGVLLEAGERISSTRIREALAAGELAQAAAMLGRPFALSGHVLYGAQLGRKLGFPTVNIALRRRVVPVRGIFAARIHGIDAVPREGIAYVGNRPAVGGAGPLLEAFVFDFDGDLYGRRVCVELLHRLRDDMNFASLEALQLQMQQDVAEARSWLKQHTVN